MTDNDNRLSFEDKGLLGEDLLKMLEQGSLNDVKIKLRDGEIHANKDILMARSDYFATMFSNNKFIEGKNNSVDMNHCSVTVMNKIVRYLFSGAVTFDGLSLAQLLELSHISEMMLLSKFKEKVDDYLQVDLICDGGKDVKFLPELILGAKIADKYNFSSMRIGIMLEVYLNLQDIPKDVASLETFKTLPFHMMRDIILFKTGFADAVPTTMHKLNSKRLWSGFPRMRPPKKIRMRLQMASTSRTSLWRS